MQPNFRSEFLHCWLDPTPSAALNFENKEKGNKDGKDQLCKTGKSQVRDNIFEDSPDRLVSSPLVTHAPMITRLPLLQLSTWKHHECSALKSAAHTSAQSKVKVNIAQITQYTRRRRDQAKSAQAHSSQSTKHKAHGVVIGSGCTFV